MKHYCTICHKIHEGRCKLVRSIASVRNSDSDKFRNSRVWKRKAKDVLERDFHCCRVCYAGGLICTDGLSVHHIIPLKVDYDKRLDEDNLITLCRYHHEQAERGTIPAARLRRLAAEGFNPGYPPRVSRMDLGD